MFYKDKKIKKVGKKVFEENEIDTVKVKERIALIETEKVRRLAEISAEFDVRIDELKKLI